MFFNLIYCINSMSWIIFQNDVRFQWKPVLLREWQQRAIVRTEGKTISTGIVNSCLLKRFFLNVIRKVEEFIYNRFHLTRKFVLRQNGHGAVFAIAVREIKKNDEIMWWKYYKLIDFMRDAPAKSVMMPSPKSIKSCRIHNEDEDEFQAFIQNKSSSPSSSSPWSSMPFEKCRQ